MALLFSKSRSTGGIKKRFDDVNKQVDTMKSVDNTEENNEIKIEELREDIDQVNIEIDQITLLQVLQKIHPQILSHVQEKFIKLIIELIRLRIELNNLTPSFMVYLPFL
ncbi:28502_t:CDS:2 [Dentiscutata erythropus]|uniref:28502_t:CDS:1 n=1 Tax=Dentiscutata erythropus TaxID=1348616 RepID=A0A9N9FRD3_9GLOM|nr:28502_t:CDS:2 [Dentiscutata erythropus]